MLVLSNAAKKPLCDGQGERDVAGFDVPLIQNDRQRTFKRRLRLSADNDSDFVQELNEAYSIGVAQQRERSLREIKKTMGRFAEERLAIVMEEIADRLPEPFYDWEMDNWCDLARQIGELDEKVFLSDLRKEILRQVVFGALKENRTVASDESLVLNPTPKTVSGDE